MEITLHISSLVIIALGTVGVLLSISGGIFCLYHNKFKDHSTLILVILLFLIGLTLWNETLTTSGISSRFKQLYFLPLNFSLSIAPLFYLFVKAKIQQNLVRVDCVHLIFPILQFLGYLIIGFQSISYKTSLWHNELFRVLINGETILFVLGILLYSILSYNLANRLSTDQLFWKEDLRKWLLRMIKVFFLIASLELVLFLGELILTARFAPLFYVFRSFLFVIMIGWLVYNTIKLLYPISIYRSLPKFESIDIAESKKLQARLDTMMNDDKIYLNPDLSLRLLSQYLDISEKKCSRFFNSILKTNFKSYINNYRVLEFKKRVSSGQYNGLTIMGIAFDSGFDSKTTFNRVFKKVEGITPSQFKKAHKKV